MCGYGLYLTALREAPLSVVHTALNGGIVLFVLLAVVGLGERVRPVEWLGVCCVVLGLIALGASLTGDAPPNATAHGIVFFAAAVAGLAVLALAIDASPGRAIGLSIATGLFLGLASVFAKTLVAADSLAAALCSRPLWLTLGTNIIGFLLMQGALQAGRGVVVVPLFSTLSNLVPIIGGILLYGEWEPAPNGAAALRPLAFVLAIGGGALLAGFGEHASPSPAGCRSADACEQVLSRTQVARRRSFHLLQGATRSKGAQLFADPRHQTHRSVRNGDGDRGEANPLVRTDEQERRGPRSRIAPRSSHVLPHQSRL